MSTRIPPGLILKNYESIDRSNIRGARDLLHMVKRYNLKWVTGSPFMIDETDSIVLRTPDANESAASSHGHPQYQRVLCYASATEARGRMGGFSAEIKRLAALPFFYRLNYIKQLSTTHFAANLEAAHNRLSHCLGTTDIAAALLESIIGKKHDDDFEVDDHFARTILLYAFLHDSYHGPFGHTLDIMRDVLWPLTEERVDKYLLQSAVDKAVASKAGPLWNALNGHFTADEKMAHTLLKGVLDLLSYDPAQRNYAVDIVDGPVDADRLDYVWRDSSHLMGVDRGAQDSVSQIVGGARALKDGSEYRLFFDISNRSLIEHILETRKKFYGAFYENPEKIVIDEMITHTISYVLCEEGVLSNQGTREDFAHEFAFLVDDDLLHFMWEVCSQPKHALSNAILQDVVADRPFATVWQRGIPVTQLDDISLRYGHLSNELRRLTEKFERNTAMRPGLVISRQADYRSQIILGIKELLNSSFEIIDTDNKSKKPPVPSAEKLFWLQNLYGNSFKKKFLLELILWDELKKWTDVSGYAPFPAALTSLAERVADYYFPLPLINTLQAEAKETAVKARAQLVKQVRPSLDETPLVFISLSWIPSCALNDLLTHSRGFGENEIHFHENGKPLTGGVQLRIRPRDEDYFALVCAPRTLVSTAGVPEAISHCFERLLTNMEWVEHRFFKEKQSLPDKWNSLLV
jgi:HD superfamily phosphohydrolase